MEFLKRQDVLLGKEFSEYISTKKVVVLGLGGVGGAAFEALCRCGVLNILVWDNDVFDITNLNRQILSLNSTVGKKKVEVAKQRAKDINKNINVQIVDEVYDKTKNDILASFKPDYVIDCIDTITHKLSVIEFCYHNKIKIVSSMGTGNKIDPFKYEIVKIENTVSFPCTMAKVIRKELRKRNIKNIDVVCSRAKMHTKNVLHNNGRNSPGSISFLPPVCGYLLSAYVINKFISDYNEK